MTTTSSFLQWFSEWGQVIYLVTQMLFWIAVAVAAVIVALQYRRFVTFKIGKHAAKESSAAAPEAPEAAQISIDEFVE